MKKVAILGPGLLGGSLALALRARSKSFVSVWARREEAVEEIGREEVADFASTNLLAVASDADLVVLCTPIGVMPGLARQLAKVVRPQTLITDVGSVKGPVVSNLSAIFDGGAQFVGSHPMAGSEQTGIQAARADLFADAVCIVTPETETDPAAVARISAFWEALGCTVRHLSPEDHDAVVALVSHLPHLLAAVLISTISEAHRDAFNFCGPGFRDTTRVASGPPGMWAEILQLNRIAVRKSAEAVIEKLREIITLLDSNPADPAMHAFLTHAKTERDRLPPSK
jgi:prephenate dehydrogenase